MKPILGIAGYKFEIERGFSDGYRNAIVAPMGKNKNYTTHTVMFEWVGGKFRPLDIQIHLAVGVQSIVTTPHKLVEILETFYRCTLPQKASGGGPSGMPRPVEITVGTWFRRFGYIEDINVTFEGPWDADTGQPMQATVRLMILPDFLTKVNRMDYPNHLPTAKNFTFKFVGAGAGYSSNNSVRKEGGAPFHGGSGDTPTSALLTW